MNTSRLKEIVDLLLALESEFGIQNKLNEANNQLSNIVQQPGHPQYQTQFSDTLDQLRRCSDGIRERLEPSNIDLIEEIRGKKYFVDDVAAKIDAWLRENAVTPAVVQQRIHEFLSERQNYINQITNLRDSLNAVGIEAVKLKAGEAEVGFLLPRSLFKNDFDLLIKELREIDFILRAFSEFATGTVPSIQVHQISTSDPQFFLGMDALTIAAIGGAVTWALNTWKQVEDVRKVRAETRKLSAFSEKEVEEIFDKKIKSTINDAIDSQTKTFLSQLSTQSGRAHEQGEHIKIALESILARIERGMTVEIRAVPPAIDRDNSEDKDDENSAFIRINSLAPKLIFPRPEVSPLLQLPKTDKEIGA